MFTGSIVALVTLMGEKDKICRSNLGKLIDYHVASGTSTIVSVDTTGKSATLSHGEHSDVMMVTLELIGGRIPVITKTGTNATTETINLTQHFNDSGVVGCLTVAPYYNRPTREGLFQHFKAIAEHTDLPQVLYNVPSRTGCDMLPETVGHPTKVKNIIAIKGTTGNLSRIRQVKELIPDDFILLNDDDATGLGFMQLGSHGVVSVTSNVATHDMTEMCKLAAAGQFAEARVISQRLMSLRNKLLVESDPIPIKRACKELGLMAIDALRLPTTPITGNAREIVKTTFEHTGLL